MQKSPKFESIFFAIFTPQKGDLVAKAQVAGEDNFMWLRTNIPRAEENPVPLEERGTEAETELAIAKKYQVISTKSHFPNFLIELIRTICLALARYAHEDIKG